MTSTPRYAKQYRVDMAAGRARTVDATRAREWVVELGELGFTTQNIAVGSGVSEASVRRLLAKPEARIGVALERALMATTPASIYAKAPDTTFVPATGSSRRLKALLRLGYRLEDIAAGAGIGADSLECVAKGSKRKTVTARTHRALAAFYDTARLTWGPSNYTRSFAKRKRYPSPLAWTEENIEDPRARAMPTKPTDLETYIRSAA